MTLNLQPVTIKDRIFSLDVIRGFALFGILIMNLPAAGLVGLYNEGAIHFYNLNHGDYYSWFVLDILASGKMRFLFSMLFGAGILLFMDKKTEGRSTTAAFYRRMIWLFAFGLVDLFLIIWTGDVLYSYALCGMVLFLFRKLNPWMLLLLGVISIGAIAWTSNESFARNKERREKYLLAETMLKEGKKLTPALDSARNKWLSKEKGMYPFNDSMKVLISGWIEEELLIKRKEFKETLLEQATSAPMAVLDEGFYWDLLEAASAMLIGMALFKWGFFGGDYSTKKYLLIAASCLVIGLPLAYAVTHGPHAHAAHHYPQYLDNHSFDLQVYDQIPRVLLAIAYAAILIIICTKGWLKWFTNIFAATGRMAFTNYLVQSVFYAIMFYGYTFNKYMAFTRNELLLMVPAVLLVQVTFSLWWLKRYEMGPLEWVWRRLTYGKPTTS